MSKVALGDKSYLERLCLQIAERILCIPVVSENETSGAAMKVEVLKIEQEGRILHPAFTSFNRFQDWLKSTGRQHENIEMLGVDFCSVLDLDAWLWIDPGYEYSVCLAPHVVDQIALKESDDGVAEAPAQVESPRAEPQPPQQQAHQRPPLAVTHHEVSQTDSVPEEQFDVDLAMENDSQSGEDDYVVQAPPGNEQEPASLEPDPSPKVESKRPAFLEKDDGGGWSTPGILNEEPAPSSSRSTPAEDRSEQSERPAIERTSEFDRPYISVVNRERRAASGVDSANKNLLDLSEDEETKIRSKPAQQAPQKRSWRDLFKRK
jgi:hypothetical protein